MPKISVIMPAYNAEKYIAQAIDSILGQTYGDFEFIILNDCSTDRTQQIIASYDDPRIVYLKNEENLGVAATLNRGLSVARGEYIARMDADDISVPDRFEKQVRYLNAHPETAVLGCSTELFGEMASPQVRHFATDERQLRVDMLFACALAHPTVMMRRQVINDLGGYDMAFEGMEDYELWCRVLEDHQITTLPEVLLRYRVHSAQVTKNLSAQYLERMGRLKQRQLEQLGVDPAYPEAEAYCALCAGRMMETAKELARLSRFCEVAAVTNMAIGIYDQKLLEKSLRAVLLRAAAALPKAQYKQALDGCRLVTAADVNKHLLKQKIKKLLGRG